MTSEDSAGEGYSFVCNACGQQFPTERKLMTHIGVEHKSQVDKSSGISVLREGQTYETPIKTIGATGFTQEERKPVDMYSALRRILANNGIRSGRESILELFEYENPTDLNALSRILSMADVAKSKQQIIISLWKRFIEGMTGEYGEGDDGMYDATQQKKKKGPMSVSPDDMMDWGPGDYLKWGMEAQKWKNAYAVQLKFMENLFGGDSSPFGGSTTSKVATPEIPPHIQAKLDGNTKEMDRLKEELNEYKQEKRRKEDIEPLLKELRYLRAETEDRKDKKNPLDEIKEFAITTKLMEQLGSKEGADIMRLQMEERLEKMRINTDKEMKEAQFRAEQLKEQNQTLQLQTLKTEMGAKMDMMNQAYQIASQSKKEDLVKTMEEAEKIVSTFKKFAGGEETSEDRRLKVIGDIINSTATTMKPVLTEIARNIGGGRPGGMQQQAPQRQQQGPLMVPPLRPGQKAWADCLTCGNQVPIGSEDLDKPNPMVVCQKCGSQYPLQRMGGQGAQTQAPMMQVPMQAPQQDFEARRQELLRQPREQLDRIAMNMGLRPEQYPDTSMLVDDLLKFSQGMG